MDDEINKDDIIDDADEPEEEEPEEPEEEEPEEPEEEETEEEETEEMEEEESSRSLAAPQFTINTPIKSYQGNIIYWDSVAGAVNYVLEYCVNSGAWNVLYIGSTNYTTYNPNISVNTVQFYCRGKDINDAWGNGRYSSIYTVQHSAPATPASISVPSTINSGSSITISWASSTGATEYLLDFKQNGGSWTRIYTGSSTSYNHSITSAMNTVQYDVAAQNSVGTSGWKTSSIYNVTHPVVAPSAPSWISIPSPIRSGTNITVSWASSSGATGYDLDFQANGSGWTIVYTGSSTSYIHYMDSSYNNVKYDVRAKNSGGTSGWTRSDTGTVYHPATTPSSLSVPGTIKVGFSASISWGTSSNVSSYELECSTNGGSYSNIYTGSSTSYNHSITSSMTTVLYRVRAKNALGDASSFRTGSTVNVNHPPTTPPSLDVPTPIKSGTSITISWGQSTDPNGDAITYELQCAQNGGSYSALYSGSNRTYSHSITASMNTLQYRVRAKDTVDLYSGWQTGSSITVQHNTPPGISGSDSDLGTLTAPPSVNYTVTDPDAGDTVKVEITLNGSLMQQINSVTLGQQQTYTLPLLQFLALKSGAYTVKITATDKAGESAVRTYTFKRAVAAVEFELKPMLYDRRARLIHLYPIFLAAPAKVDLRVCNNRLDSSPTWEVMDAGPEHIFSNTTKTAADWAVGVKVKILPSASAPSVPFVYLSKLTGIFL